MSLHPLLSFSGFLCEKPDESNTKHNIGASHHFIELHFKHSIVSRVGIFYLPLSLLKFRKDHHTRLKLNKLKAVEMKSKGEGAVKLEGNSKETDRRVIKTGD